MGNKESVKIFTVAGPIQALHIAPGVANLIQDIQNESFFTGVIAGLGGQSGVLATLASLVMYDGEDVEHVALLVNGRLAVGTFEWLHDLKAGDHVTLVVSNIDEGALFTHAILRMSDQLLWTPISINHTRRGWIMHSLKLGGVILVFTWLMAALCYLFNDSPLNTIDWIIVVFFPVALIAFVMFMSTRDVMVLGEQAEEIFQALDVPKFDRFVIKPYSVCNLHFIDDPDALKKGHIFHFSDAVVAHKKRFKLQ